MKKMIRKLDKGKRIELCRRKAPHVAMLTRHGGWLRLWDIALDLGLWHTRGLQEMSRPMSHHGRCRKPCPLCEENDFNYFSMLEHVFDAHSDRIKFDGSAEQALHQLVGGNLQFTYCFWNLFVF